jgi:molecular chaperone GrpE
LHDDDPAGGPESPESDPLEALVQPAEPKTSVEDSGALEALQQRAQLAEDRLAEVLKAYRQVKTENEGFKERITRNLERRFDQRRERLLLRFIEILDNLDRALEATEQTYTGTPMIEGIILVRTQLLSVLQEEGLERIPVLGLAFDPSVAEAVETRPVVEPEHDHVVVKELLRGYRLNGRVARPARVAVGQYHPQGEHPEEGDANLLVGADEVPEEAPSAVAQVHEGAGRDRDATLEELLADHPSAPEQADAEAAPEEPVAAESVATKPAPRPKPKAKPKTESIEIDLLKVLEDEKH